MKSLFSLMIVISTMASIQVFAKTDTSSVELKIVTQYFQNRFPSVTGSDSPIPTVIGVLSYKSLIQELASQGLAVPKAPSTVDWTLNYMGCQQTYDNGGGHQSSNYTPRCISRALVYAAALDSRIKD